jgi:hypothetical protein
MCKTLKFTLAVCFYSMCIDTGQLIKMFTSLISHEVCSNEVALQSSQEQCEVRVNLISNNAVMKLT